VVQGSPISPESPTQGAAAPLRPVSSDRTLSCPLHVDLQGSSSSLFHYFLNSAYRWRCPTKRPFPKSPLWLLVINRVSLCETGTRWVDFSFYQKNETGYRTASNRSNDWWNSLPRPKWWRDAFPQRLRCLSVYLSIYLSIYLSVHPSIYLWLLSPLLGLGRFFSFLILCTVGRTSWTGDQPFASSLPAHIRVD
jgi:hypothetical protein